MLISIFTSVNQESGITPFFNAVVRCELLAFAVAMFGEELPWQLWCVLCRINALLRWLRAEDLVHHHVLWAYHEWLNSSGGSLERLCQEALVCCGFHMHSFLHITVQSGSDCVLLSWANSRYPRGADGWQDLCCWIEFQASQLQLSKHPFGRELLGELQHPRAQCSSRSLPSHCQSAGLGHLGSVLSRGALLPLGSEGGT